MNAVRIDRFIYLLFFVSGACGLVYEVIWGKYLSLFIGNTTHAHMIVLATFMGGLAAGSFLFGRIADRVSRPLRLYAWLEIGIGFYGVLYSPILESTREIFFSLASGMEGGGIGPTLIKLTLAFLTLILPTCLMGGTLPVLSRFFIRDLGNVGKRVALLYFINSFGAVIGTLVAGFYVIEHQGLIFGLMNTGIVNVVVGLVILVADAVMERSEKPVAVDESVEPIAAYEPRIVTLAMIAICLSGFTSMIYELVWFRIFAVVLESSTYSFSLMLAAFITGITLGSLLAGRIMSRSRKLLFLFALCEFGIAAAVILSIPLYERLPYYFWTIRYLLRPIPETFVYYSILKFSLCFAIMLIPTLFFGMTLPIVSNIASTTMKQVARKIGNVYAINTVGTLLGALVTGLVLIPSIGLAHSLEMAFYMNLAIAAILIWKTPDLLSSVWKYAVAMVSIGFVAGYSILVPDWNNKSFALGVFRLRGAPPPSYAEFRKLPVHDYTLQYYKEDLSSNVAVMEHALGEGEVMISLSVNGKIDASSEGDVPTQLLVGQLPLMLKSDVEDVLLVGLGSGMTAGSVLTHPVKRLDCVEISTGVAEAGRFFAPFNHDVLNNSRFNLIVDDAKTYVNTTGKMYDIVINEPSNPWMAGIGNLFSIEFFRDIKAVLKEDGIAVQWFHRYETDDEVVSDVVRTFQRVFPYTYIFQGNTNDLIMLGSGHGITPDFARMARKLEDTAIGDELASIKIHDIPSLLSLQMMSPEYIPKISSGGSINSDYLPLIEYRAPLAFYLGETSASISDVDERFTSGNRLLLFDYLRGAPLTSEHYKRLFELFSTGPMKHSKLAYTILDSYLDLVPDDIPMQRAFARMSLDQKNHTPVLEIYRPSATEQNVAALDAYSDYLYNAERPVYSMFNQLPHSEVRNLLSRCLALDKNGEQYRLKLAQIHMTGGRYREALDHYLAIIRAQEEDPDESDISPDRVMALAGRALFELRDYENAQTFIDQAFEWNPENLVAAIHRVMIDQVALFQEIERAQVTD